MNKTAAAQCTVANRDKREETLRFAGEVLLRFGITPHLHGYEPLCSAIRLITDRTDGTGVPPYYGAHPTVSALWRNIDTEHEMRDALGVGFLITDEIHTRVFPYTNRPSSGEFVCTIAELLRDRVLITQ